MGQLPRQASQHSCGDGAGSDVADNASSIADAGSLRDSVVSSAVTDSKQSGLTYGKFSAFTAPPVYRNSGAFVHGTKFRNFESIMELGLKAAKSDIFMIDEVRVDGRVPGLQAPPEILIFIDEVKARSAAMEFEYDCTQGTWKTKGINGVIRPWFFQKVVDQRRGPNRGNVLFQSKEDPMMQANVIRGRQRPRYLLHATYWENVFGILSEGIVPAKNPTSSMRQPFKTLLQGAESHVYTVRSSAGNAPALLRNNSLKPESRRRPVADVVPEEEEGDQEHKPSMQLQVGKQDVGLEQPPDAYFIIDTEKAEELGVSLDMVQSSDREENIFVKGRVVPQLFCRAEANDPVNLPESLRAKIVDPRSFEQIPIIDLQQDEAAVVEQLRYACEVVGFMQVVGHGVSTELQDKHMALQKKFFNLPEAVKRRIALSDNCPVRGYFGKGGEDLDQVLKDKVDNAEGEKLTRQSRKDNKESLDTNGVPWSKPTGGFVAEVFGMASALPEEHELPGLRATLEEYSNEMFQLARRLLSLMAIVLELPRDFFEQHLTEPVATHRLLHYWPIKDFQNEIGVGEHTDYGLLTILKQDKVGGLQVLNAKDGTWVHACPLDNGFVVNLGDMISRWTAHRFKSTIHRVVNISPSERYSVPYFLEPNMQTRIIPGGLCHGGASDSLSSESQHVDTAEQILERFYRASGQLRVRGFAKD